MNPALRDWLARLAEALPRELVEQLWSRDSLIALAVLAAAFAIAHVLAGLAERGVGELARDVPWLQRIRILRRPIIWSTLVLLIVYLGERLFAALGLSTALLSIAVSLLAAWVVIRITVTFIRARTLRRLVAWIAWSIAALNILGLWEPIVRAFDAVRIEIGDFRLSFLSLAQGLIAFAVMLWLAKTVSDIGESRIRRLRELDPSLRELTAKLLRIGLYTVAFLAGLNAMGVDLTALAVFSGALGVGIGFGLQKVVANFISGLILLLDRSIKPGDVIETQGTYGWINHLGARYTSIITRDGTEYLIPNEDLITQPVINWSFSDRRVRRRLKVSVDYATDLEKAMALMREAAAETDRVLADPPPVVHLANLGDNGVELELRFWIEDPQNGISNVSSDVLLKIWHKFHEAGIVFPFPQRVVHMATPVQVARDGDGGGSPARA
ncbi:MAG: hypothetical protein KatS3mg119_1561 [Rhodothalassiaceae bacterium]|nr:MAG: hypothetical protein KatS3mg119_1561 [Rhodothalassiaceae bacterium]